MYSIVQELLPMLNFSLSSNWLLQLVLKLRPVGVQGRWKSGLDASRHRGVKLNLVGERDR
jgi:hypothetical protein